MNSIQHVALIMDGNGRWAQSKKRPRVYGHIKGARVAKKIINHASDSGVKYLTLYTFSTENWLRPQEEVGFLMRLLDRYVKKETQNFIKKNIRFKVIGQMDKIPEPVRSNVIDAMKKTAHCTGLQANFAISYGSRDEITQAVKSIVESIKAQEYTENDITESMISNHLMTKDVPDPDLIIRTSGEYRLSNFLMWQAAYSEFVFTDVLWPNFTEKDFDSAIGLFSKRTRRFGQVEGRL